MRFYIVLCCILINVVSCSKNTIKNADQKQAIDFLPPNVQNVRYIPNVDSFFAKLKTLDSSSKNTKLAKFIQDESHFFAEIDLASRYKRQESGVDPTRSFAIAQFEKDASVNDSILIYPIENKAKLEKFVRDSYINIPVFMIERDGFLIVSTNQSYATQIKEQESSLSLGKKGVFADKIQSSRASDYYFYSYNDAHPMVLAAQMEEKKLVIQGQYVDSPENKTPRINDDSDHIQTSVIQSPILLASIPLFKNFNQLNNSLGQKIDQDNTSLYTEFAQQIDSNISASLGFSDTIQCSQLSSLLIELLRAHVSFHIKSEQQMIDFIDRTFKDKMIPIQKSSKGTTTEYRLNLPGFPPVSAFIQNSTLQFYFNDSAQKQQQTTASKKDLEHIWAKLDGIQLQKQVTQLHTQCPEEQSNFPKIDPFLGQTMTFTAQQTMTAFEYEFTLELP